MLSVIFFIKFQIVSVYINCWSLKAAIEISVDVNQWRLGLANCSDVSLRILEWNLSFGPYREYLSKLKQVYSLIIILALWTLYSCSIVTLLEFPGWGSCVNRIYSGSITGVKGSKTDTTPQYLPYGQWENSLIILTFHLWPQPMPYG